GAVLLHQPERATPGPVVLRRTRRPRGVERLPGHLHNRGDAGLGVHGDLGLIRACHRPSPWTGTLSRTDCSKQRSWHDGRCHLPPARKDHPFLPTTCTTSASPV